MNNVVSERERPLYRHGEGAPNLVGFDTGCYQMQHLTTRCCVLRNPKHQIGANSTLDRNSQQAKIAGRSNGLTVDLRGH
jgi:hypothetical protein